MNYTYDHRNVYDKKHDDDGLHFADPFKIPHETQTDVESESRNKGTDSMLK